MIAISFLAIAGVADWGYGFIIVGRVDRGQLVAAHMYLVEVCGSQVYRRVRRHVEKDELISWGMTGLLQAADRYDPGVGVTFATFAKYRIHGAIQDGLRAMGRLSQRCYRRKLAMTSIALDEDDPPDELIDCAGQADRLLEKKQLRARLGQAMAGLPARERHFIEKCYFEDKTVSEAGQELGLSRSWSSRLHARALATLRRELACDRLRDG